MNIILYSIVIVAATGVILGLVIGLAVLFFGTETDPRVEKIEDLLPGANCGGCGFAGCADFALALAEGRAVPEQCPVCSEEAGRKISDLLGLKHEQRASVLAIVRCSGHRKAARESTCYNGVNDCKSANMVAGGSKACRYGCLGLGSCARACPFGAIELRHGLAVVHPELCVGCGKCVRTCPRNLIILTPETHDIHVYCNSPEKGAAKRKICSVSCIGCRKCVKASEDGQIEMDGFLARVNYEYPEPAGKDILEKAACPTKALRSAKNLAAEKINGSKKEAA